MIVSYFKFRDLEFADSATLSNVSSTDLIVNVLSCILYTILNDVKFLYSNGYSNGDYYIVNGYLVHGTSYTYYSRYGSKCYIVGDTVDVHFIGIIDMLEMNLTDLLRKITFSIDDDTLNFNGTFRMPVRHYQYYSSTKMIHCDFINILDIVITGTDNASLEYFGGIVCL